MNRSRKSKSIKQILLTVFFVMTAPIPIILFAISQYSIDQNNNRAYETILSYLQSTVNHLDTELSLISNYLIREQSDSEWIARVGSAKESEATVGYTMLGRQLNNNLNMFNLVEGVVVCNLVRNEEFYRYTSRSRDYLQRESIVQYVLNEAERLKTGQGDWKSYTIDGKDVLLCCIGDNKTLLCAWITGETLYNYVGTGESEDTSYYFVSRENRSVIFNEPITTTSEDINTFFEENNTKNNTQYLTTNVSSSIADFDIYQVQNRYKISGVFHIMQIASLILLLLQVAILVPYMLRQLNKAILDPMNRVENGIDLVEKGHLDTKISNEPSCKEIEHLIDSFNGMISQISSLKVQAYEEELKNQQLQMDYLQLQIEPHFYLNAMNLISTMAQVGDTALIQELTKNLSLYLRYIVNTRKGWTTIGEEVDHISSYLKIMEIRMGESFAVSMDIDKFLSGMKIPPLMIQLLIENTMKYAFDIYGANGMTALTLAIWQDENNIHVDYHDNGPGYPESILSSFEKDEAPEGNHIGLWNLKKRLDYMYPGGNTFSLFNDNGAHTKITISKAWADIRSGE